MILLRATRCGGIRPTICPQLRDMTNRCRGQVYDLRPPPPALPCGIRSQSGGAGVTVHWYALGDVPGMVSITYNMVSIPDKLDAYHNGVLVATTGGPVQFSVGSPLTFMYTAEGSKRIKVVVTGPDGTAWTYTVGCPVP